MLLCPFEASVEFEQTSCRVAMQKQNWSLFLISVTSNLGDGLASSMPPSLVFARYLTFTNKIQPPKEEFVK